MEKQIPDFLSSHLVKFAFYQDIFCAVQIEKTEYNYFATFNIIFWNLVTRVHDNHSLPD